MASFQPRADESCLGVFPPQQSTIHPLNSRIPQTRRERLGFHRILDDGSQVSHGHHALSVFLPSYSGGLFQSKDVGGESPSGRYYSSGNYDYGQKKLIISHT